MLEMNDKIHCSINNHYTVSYMSTLSGYNLYSDHAVLLRYNVSDAAKYKLFCFSPHSSFYLIHCKKLH